MVVVRMGNEMSVVKMQREKNSRLLTFHIPHIADTLFMLNILAAVLFIRIGG